MIFRRHKEEIPPEPFDVEVWAKLLLMSQLNSVSLAKAALLALDHPEAFTYEMRMELEVLIKELEYGVARFQEHVI